MRHANCIRVNEGHKENKTKTKLKTGEEEETSLERLIFMAGWQAVRLGCALHMNSHPEDGGRKLEKHTPGLRWGGKGGSWGGGGWGWGGFVV